MKTVPKILLALLPIYGYLPAYAQNWSAFGTTQDTLIYEVYDPTLTSSNLLPFVEGITASADEFGMSPLYGLRIAQTSDPLDPIQIWKGEPVNNLLYSDNTMGYGRFPLEEVRQHQDTVWLKSGTDVLEFRLNSQPTIPVLAMELSDGDLYLVLDSIYGTNGGGDTLAAFRGLVFDNLMNPIPAHRFHDKPLVLLSKNRGLLFFPDMSFVEERLVTFLAKEYAEPLQEDIFNFDIGDKFLFKDTGNGDYYYKLVEIIDKTETDSSFIYSQKETNKYPYSLNTHVQYTDRVVKKDNQLRNLLYEESNSPLFLDSVDHGVGLTAGNPPWTYIHAPSQMQERRILLMPNSTMLEPITELCFYARMYIEGVGELYGTCSPPPSGTQPLYHQINLLAYQKVNGDSYGYISANFSIDEWQQNAASVYPNPVTDVLYVTGTSENYKIVDMRGQTVQQMQMASGLQQNGISLAHLPAGVYVIHITQSDGTVRTCKIIKE